MTDNITPTQSQGQPPANPAMPGPVLGSPGTDRKKRPIWLRFIIYSCLTIVGLFVLLMIIGILAGKSGTKDVTSALRKAAGDPTLATKAGFTGTIAETTPAAAPSSPGFQTNFHWLPGTNGIQIDIATFDTVANATTAFKLFKDDGGHSLLVGPKDGTTVYDSFSKGRVDSKIAKEFHCAQRKHQYSCGSIPAGLPAIVIMRLPMEANWHQSAPASTDDNPMAGLERTFAKTDAQAKAMRLVDERLQRLGLDVQLPELKK